MSRGHNFVAILVVGAIAISLDPASGASLYVDKLRTFPVVPSANFYDDSICLSPGCIHIASRLLKNMDQTVDPCDDFYLYSCGSYIKNAVIPDQKTSLNTFEEIDDKMTEQLRTVIEEKDQPGDPKAFRIVKDLYTACMNKDLAEERGLGPSQGVIQRLGGWPVVDGANWDEGSFSWTNTVYQFLKEGFSVDYLINFSIDVDVKKSTTRVIGLDEASLGLARIYLIKGLEDRLVSEYHKYQVDLAVIFGAEEEQAKKEMREALEFEVKLATISLPDEDRRDYTKLYNPMKISELQQNFPSVPWLEYVRNIVPSSIHVGEDEVIIVAVPEFITKLEKLLSETPKRVVANYMMWRAVSSTVSFLDEATRARQLKYLAALTGRQERESRWKECVGLLSGSLPLSVGSLYVRRFFREDTKRDALDLVADIRDEMIRILETVEWMDDVTRKAAIEKALSMTSHIAYPDELLDNSKLDEYYNGLKVDPNLYLESILNLRKFGTEHALNQLRQAVNKTEWVTHGRPAIVNAFYAPDENSIQFPAGILQGSFFSSESPRYMNYGAIGWVIGHEITHGFDDQGRQFDKDGNLVDWWAEETQRRYLEKAGCIIEQYGNYTAKEVDMQLNGVNTQGENIADNGGVKEAYRAYTAWDEKYGPEEKLPGLPLLPKQLFWVSAASTWCSKYRPETLRVMISTGVHSPGEFRVKGPLSNQEDFARDFNCPLGSNMNPLDKCQVW